MADYPGRLDDRVRELEARVRQMERDRDSLAERMADEVARQLLFFVQTATAIPYNGSGTAKPYWEKEDGTLQLIDSAQPIEPPPYLKSGQVPASAEGLAIRLRKAVYWIGGECPTP